MRTYYIVQSSDQTAANSATKLGDGPSELPPPEPQGRRERSGLATCYPDPRCPELASASFQLAGWQLMGSHLGWTRDGVQHFMLWEDAAAVVTRESAGRDNSQAEPRRQ